MIVGSCNLHTTPLRRHLHYALDVESPRTVVAFLTEDCCGGRPELCGYPNSDRHQSVTGPAVS